MYVGLFGGPASAPAGLISGKALARMFRSFHGNRVVSLAESDAG